METAIETEVSRGPPTRVDSPSPVECPIGPLLENVMRNPGQNFPSHSASIPTARLRCMDPTALMPRVQVPMLGQHLLPHIRGPRSLRNRKCWQTDTSMTTPRKRGTAEPVAAAQPARRFGTIKRKRSRRSSILHPPGTVSRLPCCSHRSYACGSLSCARSSIQTKARLY